MIRDCEIRRQRPLPEIAEDEKPFALPEGWAWCRFGDLIYLISGQHIEANEYNLEKRGVPYLTGPSDFGDKNPIFSKWSKKNRKL